MIGGRSGCVNGRGPQKGARDVRIPLPAPANPSGDADRWFDRDGARGGGLAPRVPPAARGASTFGIVIYRAGSPDAVRQIMADDPVVRAGVMRAQVFPFRIAGVAPGLSTEA